MHQRHFYVDADGTTRNVILAGWQRARATRDVPTMLCQVMQIAAVLQHELMHNCGETHLPIDGQDCEFQWIVQTSWLAAVQERYGSCLDGTCCGDQANGLVGSITPSGGATAWGSADGPDKLINNQSCFP